MTTAPPPATPEVGIGCAASNQRRLRLFCTALPIRDALRHKLTYTRRPGPLQGDGPAARRWWAVGADTCADHSTDDAAPPEQP